MSLRLGKGKVNELIKKFEEYALRVVEEEWESILREAVREAIEEIERERRSRASSAQKR